MHAPGCPTRVTARIRNIKFNVHFLRVGWCGFVTHCRLDVVSRRCGCATLLFSFMVSPACVPMPSPSTLQRASVLSVALALAVASVASAQVNETCAFSAGSFGGGGAGLVILGVQQVFPPSSLPPLFLFVLFFFCFLAFLSVLLPGCVPVGRCVHQHLLPGQRPRHWHLRW